MEIGALVLAAGSAAAELAKIIDEGFSFSSECRELQGRCNAIRSILNSNPQLINQNIPALAELRQRLDKCTKYLESCKERWFIRNPIFEVTFHRRIDKYKSRLDSWIIITTLSLAVCLRRFKVGH